MKTFPIRVAHRHLSMLLNVVEQGEEVILTKGGKSMYVLKPMGVADKEVEVDPCKALSRIEGCGEEARKPR